MDQNIFRYTWRYSRRQQIWLLVVVLISLPFYFLSLDLPKRIVNGPILGQGFASPLDTDTAGRIALNRRTWLFGGGSVFLWRSRFELERIPMLLYLCLLFSFRADQRLLQVLHFYLQGPGRRTHAAALALPACRPAAAFPIAQFRRLRSSEIATMIKDEVEPLGASWRRLRPAGYCSARR
jgi:putative ABC transport system ATP-binding protein